MEIDILTGKPKIFGQASREQRIEAEKHKLVKDIETGQQVERELASKDGRLIVKLLKSGLDKRIEYLVNNDPEAKAKLDILKAIGVIIKIGKVSAERLVAMQLGLDK